MVKKMNDKKNVLDSSKFSAKNKLARLDFPLPIYGAVRCAFPDLHNSDRHLMPII